MKHHRTNWEERYQGRRDDPIRPPSRFLQQHLHYVPRGRALDVACGDGRHALFLARHGLAVDAIDFARAGLVRAREIARREGLAVHLVQADLESFPLPREKYAAAVNIRYLQRSLWLPLKRSLVAGGVVIFETFLRQQQGTDHVRNPAFLLEPGELSDNFADLDILLYQEGLFDSEGEPAYLARMVARRP